MNKVKNMAYWKSKNQGSKSDFSPAEQKVDLTKTPVGPIATKKPFDRDKFEEDTRVAQGMENVEQELFSDKSTHDIVKKNLKNKKK